MDRINIPTYLLAKAYADSHGGSSDYTSLTNKPQINSVVLTGNKSLSDLGIGSADAVSANANAISAIKDGVSIDSFAEVETALADKADQSEVDDIKSETATLTGNPITITDALAADAISVVAEIEPSQDLHGYDRPWSGGSGKNKLPLVLADIKTVNTDGTWSGNAYTIDGVTFTINTDAGGNITSISASGSASGNKYLTIPTYNISAGEYKIISNPNPAVEGGDYRTNIKIGETTDYMWNNTFIINKTIESDTTIDVELVVKDASTGISFTPMVCSSLADATFEPYSNICPISGMTEVNVTTTDGTDTNTASASLGTTVYGGSVDVTEGSASVERVSVDLGTIDYSVGSVGEGTLFYSAYNPFPNMKNTASISDVPNALCSNMIVAAQAYVNSGEIEGLSIGPDNARIRISSNSTYKNMSAADFKTAMSGVQLCYELATPTTLSFTSDNLSMLDGENSVSTDAEEVSVEYIKDTLAGRVKHLEDESGVVNYSTTEQKTGQKWIDGKPIYQKTIAIDNPVSTGATTSITHGIADIEAIVGICGGAYVDSTIIDISSFSSSNYRTLVYASPVNIAYELKWGSSTFTRICVTVQYTKTTD